MGARECVRESKCVWGGVESERERATEKVGVRECVRDCGWVGVRQCVRDCVGEWVSERTSRRVCVREILREQVGVCV